MKFDLLSSKVIGCALEVHKELGPGLLESTYQQCLAHEMSRNGIPFRMEHPVSVKYKEIFLDCGYRLDFLVEDELIIECKSIEEFAPIHSAQVLTYLRLSRASKALLVNFNVYRLKQGIKRFVL